MSSHSKNVSAWKRFFQVLGIVFVLVVSVIGYNVYELVHWKIPESYDAWTSGTLMVGYLESHTNQWPRSWNDLASATNYNRPMSVFVPIDRLRQVVKIDWQMDVKQLQELARTNPSATIQVVMRLDGSPLQAVWGPDTEPNAKIMNYIRWTLTAANTVPGLKPDVSVGLEGSGS